MKKKSFTLVEIMIVVAIIAILAAIAVPSLTQNRETAMEQTKKANLKMLNGAVANYLAKNPTASSDTVVTGDVLAYLTDADGEVPTDLTFMTVGGSTASVVDGKAEYN